MTSLQRMKKRLSARGYQPMESRYAADYATADAVAAAFDPEGFNPSKVQYGTAYGQTLPEAVRSAIEMDKHGEAYRLRREVCRGGKWETVSTYRLEDFIGAA